jgi:hypothetical protein
MTTSINEYKLYLSPLLEDIFPIQIVNKDEMKSIVDKYSLTKVDFTDELIPDEGHYQVLEDTIEITDEGFEDDIMYSILDETTLTPTLLVLLSKLYDIHPNKENRKELLNKLKKYREKVTDENIANTIDKIASIISKTRDTKAVVDVKLLKTGLSEIIKKPEMLLFSQGKEAKRVSSITDYILQNRKSFPLFVKGEFKKAVDEYKFQPIRMWNPQSNEFGDRLPFNQQKFVSYYLSEYTPYRGLLLYHGLGSGKTGASIIIAEGFRDRRVAILLPASLRTNYENEILRFGESAYKKQFNWEFVELPFNTETNELYDFVYEGLKEKGLEYDLVNRIITKKGETRGIYMINYSSTQPNYNNLPDIDRILLDTQIRRMLNWKYTVLHYNAGVYTIPKLLEECLPTGVYRQILKKLFNVETKTEYSLESTKVILNHIYNPDNHIPNPFDDKVVIIDEIHNITSHLTGSGYIAIMLYELIMRAKNVKLVFLSGTPVINNSYELGLLFNMLSGFIYEYSMEVSSKTAVFNKDELDKLLKKSKYIDRLNIDMDKKTVHFTLVPRGFENDIVDGTYSGVKKATSDVVETFMIDDIISLLEKNNYSVNIDSIKENLYTLFPDILNHDIESNLLIKKGRPRKSTRIDLKYLMGSTKTLRMNSDIEFREKPLFVNTFKDRIQGFVSFYNEIAGIDEKTGYNLFPEKIDASPEETEVIMSDYQFVNYCFKREEEQVLEQKSAFMKKIMISKKVDFGSIPNTFRVFTRQAGIFVFPPNVKRPVRKVKVDYTTEYPLNEILNMVVTLLAKTSKEERYNKLEKMSKKMSSKNIPNIVKSLIKVYSLSGPEFDVFTLDKLKNTIFTVDPDLASYKRDSELLNDIEEDDDIADEGIEEKDNIILADSCDKDYGECSVKEEIADKVFDVELKNAISSLHENNLRPHSVQSDNGASVNNFTLDVLSPKYVKMLENIDKANGLVLCYSQYRTVEGIELFARVLLNNGYTQYTPNPELIKIVKGMRVRYQDSNEKWQTGLVTDVKILKRTGERFFIIDNNEAEKYRRFRIFPCQYALWTGTESIAEREPILNAFNSDDNMYGQNCLILMITQSGAEGISLFNVRQVHIMEPYWNNVRIKQVIGRARRIRSHIKLPKEEQNVKVFQYVIKFDKEQIESKWIDRIDKETVLEEFYSDGKSGQSTDSQISSIIKTFNAVLKEDKNLTSDQTLDKIATDKDVILAGYISSMKEAAIDCDYNFKDNIKSDPSLTDMQCYQNIQNIQTTPFIYEYNVTKSLSETLGVDDKRKEYITTEFIFGYPNPLIKGEKIKLKVKVDSTSDKAVSVSDIKIDMPVYDTITNMIVGKIVKLEEKRIKIDFEPSYLDTLKK